MKKLILTLIACVTASVVMAFPKAFYIKQGDTYYRYSFAVAGELEFRDGGQTLVIPGYNTVVNLNDAEVSFSAPIQSTLTPSENKQKLIDVASEANSMFNLMDNAEMVRMIYTFTNPIKTASGYLVEPASYDVDKEYWDVHNAFKSMMKSMKALAGGDAAAIRKARTNAIDLYKVEDYFGVFTANPKTEHWDKTADADYLEIRYRSQNGDNYSVKLEAEGQATTWNTPDANVQLPGKMKITFKLGNTELANMVITSRLVQDKSIDMTIVSTLNGYVVNDVISITNDKITDEINVTINGKYFYSHKADVVGKNLLVYDEMKDDIINASHHHDAEDNCIDGEPDKLLRHFIRANAHADVLEKLQIDGRGIDFSSIYRELDREVDYNDLYAEETGWYISNLRGKILKHSSDYSTLTYEYENPDILNKQVKLLNDYSDISFSYDKNGKTAGYIVHDYIVDADQWETDQDIIILDGYLVNVYKDEEWDYQSQKYIVKGWYYDRCKWVDGDYDWNTSERVYVDESQIHHVNVITENWYEYSPSLVFPDLTSFTFEDFFDEESFKVTIDDYNSIVDTYESIVGPLEVDDDYWYNH